MAEVLKISSNTLSNKQYDWIFVMDDIQYAGIEVDEPLEGISTLIINGQRILVPTETAKTICQSVAKHMEKK